MVKYKIIRLKKVEASSLASSVKRLSNKFFKIQGSPTNAVLTTVDKIIPKIPINLTVIRFKIRFIIPVIKGLNLS